MIYPKVAGNHRVEIVGDQIAETKVSEKERQCGYQEAGNEPSSTGKAGRIVADMKLLVEFGRVDKRHAIAEDVKADQKRQRDASLDFRVLVRHTISRPRIDDLDD